MLKDALSPAPSLSDRARSTLVDAISSGEILPGERIKEAEIARNLQIGRGTLREAIRRLEGQLLERRQNRGVFVIDLTKSDCDDLFIIREALEGAACGLAAERMTKDDLNDLSVMLDRHADTTAQTGHYRQWSPDDDFHYRIIERSGSPRLRRALCGELYLQVRLYRFRSASRPGRAQAALSEHRQILEALQQRDAVAAEAAMRLHISNARKCLVWEGRGTSAQSSCT